MRRKRRFAAAKGTAFIGNDLQIKKQTDFVKGENPLGRVRAPYIDGEAVVSEGVLVSACRTLTLYDD
jgi:hypothetical protein